MNSQSAISEAAFRRLWHATAAADALAALETSPAGLSAAEATSRRARFGANVLPKRRPTPVWVLYLRQFKSPLIYLLLAAAGVSLAIGALTDALFIFIVLQLNAAIGTVQEWRAATSAEALDAMIRNRVAVRRDGRTHLVDSADLVPGDMVQLESGSLVPADLRLIEAREATADESLLTGESFPVGKDPGAVLPAETPIGDRSNMLFAGSILVAGRALGAVAHSGLHTEIGRIAQALAAVESPPPPLVLRLRRFTAAIGYVVLAAVAALAIAQFLQGMAPAQIFFVAVALAVSAIPEGLPVAITVALSVAARRMAKRRVIVRALPAVEGLGECTLIASDKTGTLTCNELTVKRLVLADGREFQVEGGGFSPEGHVLDATARPPDPAAEAALRRLAGTGALCNEATFRMIEGTVERFGDTVDVAFLVLAAKLGLSRDQVLARCPEAGVLPFEPARRFAAAFHRDGDGTLVSVKGAAEVVLPMCRDAGDALARAEALAADGYRVLAVAGAHAPGRIDAGAAALRDLEFHGLVGLIDPVRPEAPDAVRRCRAAGIVVVMVTGDHPATALAIARELGIAESTDEVVTGGELKELADDPAALAATIAAARVFARVEPVQKLLIVQTLQRQGHLVAVTGDGVNDAPALHAAHIGVAMGKEGTDVARGAADLIIADDNFASIVNGIEEGRVAYDNVRKVIYLLVSTGAAEIVVFFLALLWQLPLPLFAAQLLWLNLVTNGIQDVTLAFEKGEPDIIARAPRPPRQRIFDRFMIEQTLISGAVMGAVGALYFRGALGAGVAEGEARNGLFLLLVLFENPHVFNCRSESRSLFRMPFAGNPWLFLVVPAALGVHVLAMFTPGLKDVLQVRPPSLETWAILVPLALSVVVAMELYKMVVHRGRRRAV